MGTSIIAALMIEYYYDYNGYWWELLHEIIHGRKMGAWMYQKPVLFDEWIRFFNEGEHNQAYEYQETPFDRRVKYGEWN
jgi:hypothetical protein